MSGRRARTGALAGGWRIRVVSAALLGGLLFAGWLALDRWLRQPAGIPVPVSVDEPGGAAPPARPESLPDSPETALLGTIRRGDDLPRALARHGIDRQTGLAVERALRPVLDPRKVRAGFEFIIETGPDGELVSFRLIASPSLSYYVRREGSELAGYRIEEPAEVSVALVAGRLQGGLAETLTAAGERPELARRLAAVFAWSVDLVEDVRPGDTFAALVEKRFRRDGSFDGYGRVLAAEYDGAVTGRRLAVRFESEDPRVGEYYDPSGVSVRRAFLRTPLDRFALSSDFGMRFHPILHEQHFHSGVDYAAPAGTPVVSVADGVVVRAGWQGDGGLTVSIEHAGRFTSVYAHLSQTMVAEGQAVAQGETIGRVGCTGRCTGPHLHFGLLYAGMHVDPVEVAGLGGDTLPGRYAGDFQALMDSVNAALTGDGPPDPMVTE